MLSRLKVGQRLALAFGAIFLIGTALVGTAIYKINAMQEALRVVVTVYDKRSEIANHMLDAVHVSSRVVRSIALLDDQSRKEVEAVKLAEADARYEEWHKKLEPQIVTPEGKALFAEINALRQKANDVNAKVLQLAMANQDAEAIDTLLGEKGQPVNQLRETLAEFADLQRSRVVTRYEETYAAASAARLLMLGVGGVALVLGALVGVWVTRSITVPLRQAVAVAESVAAGDLTTAVHADGHDEASRLLHALRDMQESLRKVVSTVRRNSETVAVESAQIAQGNLDLSGRTEEQAQALQQTAATMEELATTVRNNAESAEKANDLARAASEVATRGGVVVGEVVTKMQGISDSSGKINDIIGVIDSIAFQTNILALNAAVEAARAGEQGRGFAVVAAEVRSLAQRSAEAAKEIKTLISLSVAQVEQGTALVDQAGKTMDEILGSIRGVTNAVAEITSASAEQSEGIQRVGDAVSQIDQATQQNTALVEEGAAAAESLKGQAQQLVQTVLVFKLPADDAGQVASATAASKPERRSAHRATNVVRPVFKPAPAPAAEPKQSTPAVAKTGTEDWDSF
jgi:methyl-accepting chemotaxis protein